MTFNFGVLFSVYTFYIRSFIVAHFTVTSAELMSGAKSEMGAPKFNQPTNQPAVTKLFLTFTLQDQKLKWSR